MCCLHQEKDHLGVTALQQAVAYNHHEIVALLVARGDCEIDAVDDEMVTGLHLAAMEGNLDIAIMLVDGLERIKPNNAMAVRFHAKYNCRGLCKREECVYNFITIKILSFAQNYFQLFLLFYSLGY